MRILGLDVGDRRIGVAVSDESCTLSTPIEVIERKDDEHTMVHLKEIISNYDISEIVVGLPKGMDGENSEQTRKVYSFIVLVKREIKLPIKLWDERLTTVMAEKVLIKANMRRNNRKGIIDKLSASIILQNYLDNKKDDLTTEDRE
ncbi:MAG: Holliday junction resolvase RuvX [bacterium]|nr:Holliday junction resolvase RuvX [bacterium]